MNVVSKVAEFVNLTEDEILGGTGNKASEDVVKARKYCVKIMCDKGMPVRKMKDELRVNKATVYRHIHKCKTMPLDEKIEVAHLKKMIDEGH